MTLQVATPDYFANPAAAAFEGHSAVNSAGGYNRRLPARYAHGASSISTHRGATALVAEFPDLLRAAQNGDDLAFASLIRHYRRFAEVAAQRILRTEEAAADAVQEAMFKVYRALPKFQDGNFRSWLLRIVKNTCYDHLRQQTRRQTLSLDELTEYDEAETSIGARTTDDRENPESVVVHQEAMQLLMSAIDELPPCHRAVIMLVDIHGLDYIEAANYLDVPMGTVKSRLSRARATLRDHLTALGLVPGEVA